MTTDEDDEAMQREGVGRQSAWTGKQDPPNAEQATHTVIRGSAGPTFAVTA
jgi:hypothetical protein